MPISAADRVVNEGDTFDYQTTLKDGAGDPIALANIVSAELTLFLGREDEESESPTIINSRDEQDVLNANNVTIDATEGTLLWRVQPEDTAIVSEDVTPGYKEPHTAKFRIVYDTDRVKSHFVPFFVLNRTRSP